MVLFLLLPLTRCPIARWRPGPQFDGRVSHQGPALADARRAASGQLRSLRLRPCRGAYRVFNTSSLHRDRLWERLSSRRPGYK